MTHDEMVELITDVRAERDRLAAELAAERERAQHLDDMRQVLERDKGILQAENARLEAELAEARREVLLHVHRGDQSEGMLKVAVRELAAEHGGPRQDTGGTHGGALESRGPMPTSVLVVWSRNCTARYPTRGSGGSIPTAR